MVVVVVVVVVVVMVVVVVVVGSVCVCEGGRDWRGRVWTYHHAMRLSFLLFSLLNDRRSIL